VPANLHPEVFDASPSVERARWPVLVFSPGWGTPREAYTGLASDLASRGYVVVLLSHPYETPASLLADGRVVDQSPRAGILSANMADMSAIRTADSSFVLDQLTQLDRIESASALATLEKASRANQHLPPANRGADAVTRDVLEVVDLSIVRDVSMLEFVQHCLG
jgi:hypothetical protein